MTRLGTSAVRGEVATDLQDALTMEQAADSELAPVSVYPYGRELDRIEDPVILVETASVGTTLTKFGRIHRLILVVVSPVVTPGAGDIALDDVLDRVLRLIDNRRQMTWQSAERATYMDTYPAYRITIERTV